MGSSGSSQQILDGITFCSSENSPCYLYGQSTNQNVIYSNSDFTKAHFRNVPAGSQIMCSDSTFGDPDPQNDKLCLKRNVLKPQVDPNGYPMYNGTPWIKCANENGTCSVGTTTDVLYGANGNFISGVMMPGSTLQCNSSVFGPVSTQNNACYVLPGTLVTSPMSTTSITQSTQSSTKINNGISPTITTTYKDPTTGNSAVYYGWNNIDFPGNDIDYKQFSNEMDCAQACANQFGCNYYSYAPGNCYLKSAKPNNSNTTAKFLFGP